MARRYSKNEGSLARIKKAAKKWVGLMTDLDPSAFFSSPAPRPRRANLIVGGGQQRISGTFRFSLDRKPKLWATKLCRLPRISRNARRAIFAMRAS